MIFVGAFTCLLVGIVVGFLIRQFNVFPVPPIPDWGHRLFQVKNEHAHDTLLQILYWERHKPFRGFDSGPTHQTIMKDGMTVIAWFDPGVTENLPPNGYSVAALNPRISATIAEQILIKAGFTAEETILEDDGVTLVIIQSDAFKGFVLVFRQAITKLPPPRWRTLPKLFPR